MTIDPSSVVKNKHRASGVGFFHWYTYGFVFIQVYEDALDLSGFLVGAAKAVTMEGIFEEGYFDRV